MVGFFKSMKKASEVGVDQIPTSNQKPGTSKQDDLPSNPIIALSTQQPNIQSSEQVDEPMEMDFCGPSSPPWFGQSAPSKHGSYLKGSDHTPNIPNNSNRCVQQKPRNTRDRSKHKVRQSISHNQRNQSPLYK